MKRMILLAVAAASVTLFALPAVASAGTWHVQNGTIGFSGSGGASQFFPASGTVTDCSSSVTVNGQYETTTTGWIELTYHGCFATTIFNPACTTSGQSSGTIKTTKLTFHNIQLAGGKPGILITPNHDGHFASYSCFGIATKVTGNGVIGELNRSCGEKSSTATISFASKVPGTQTHTQITGAGTSYGLESSTGGGAPVKMSLNASWTIGFAGGLEQAFDCTS